MRRISADETRSLRIAVLRPGYPASEAIFSGDEEPDTVHFGAFEAGQLVGIASLYLEAPPAVVEVGALSPNHAWRLRGMAVDPAQHGRGHGRALLDACMTYIARQGGGVLWCNARTGALGFYRRCGFQTWGEEFEIPTVGPHYVMSREIPPVLA